MRFDRQIIPFEDEHGFMIGPDIYRSKSPYIPPPRDAALAYNNPMFSFHAYILPTH
jgi:hypothetical protein